MADRERYNQCIRPFITGSKPKEQRKLDFCIGAKICSGKATDRDEAERICSLPKEPKTQKVRARKNGTKSCEKESLELTQCMMDYFETKNLYKEILNINSVGNAIANAMLECRCQIQQ